MAKQGLYPAYTRKADAEGRTVILTGATGTVGTATALNLAKQNCRLIMACRNIEKCKVLRRELVLLSHNHSISCRRLNLEDIDSINDFADDMIKNEPRIDTLINNAAIKHLPDRELTKYGIEKQFWVNFLAPYLLTLRLLTKLKESARETEDSRVVNIVGRPKVKWNLDPNDINFDKRKYSSKAAYRQSKLALAYFTIMLNKFYQDANVRAFGISLPDIGSISPILEHRPDPKASNFLYDFVSNWWTVTAHGACGSTVLCAIDKYMLKEDGGGGCYSYISRIWGRNKGWGEIGNRDLDAQIVWNLGAKILLGLSKKKTTTSCFDTIKSDSDENKSKK